MRQARRWWLLLGGARRAGAGAPSGPGPGVRPRAWARTTGPRAAAWASSPSAWMRCGAWRPDFQLGFKPGLPPHHLQRVPGRHPAGLQGAPRPWARSTSTASSGPWFFFKGNAVRAHVGMGAGVRLGRLLARRRGLLPQQRSDVRRPTRLPALTWRVVVAAWRAGERTARVLSSWSSCTRPGSHLAAHRAIPRRRRRRRPSATSRGAASAAPPRRCPAPRPRSSPTAGATGRRSRSPSTPAPPATSSKYDARVTARAARRRRAGHHLPRR